MALGPAGESTGSGDDRQLIDAAQRGDARAFEDLVLRHRDRIYWIARQVVRDREEARDVAQNVLVRLWRMLPRYDTRYAFTTWLYRMTVNLAIDALRRARPRQRLSSLDDDLVLAEPSAPPATGALARLQAREVDRVFSELSDCLPPQQRLVFSLREIEGLSSEEVAEILSLSPSTVRNHLFQARRTLRLELERRYPEYLPKRAAERKPGRAAKDKP